MKRIVLWCLTVICWCMAGWCGRQIFLQADDCSLRLDANESGITRQTAELMGERYHLAAYEAVGRLTATAPATGREIEISAFRTAGDNRLITGSRLADGSFGLGDRGDCVLSTGAALELFGNVRGAGLTVAAAGKEWYVRGVFEAESEVILLPAEPAQLMTELEFRFAETGDNRTAAEQACLRYGISEYYKLIDYSFVGAIARLLLWLPFLVILFFVRKIKRIIIRTDTYLPAAGLRFLCHGLEVMFWAGFFLFVFQAFRFPSGFVPAKWSDFHFWTIKWQESRESIGFLLTSPMMKDAVLRNWLTGSLSLSAAATVCSYAGMSALVPAVTDWLKR